jgi:ankyrin repeat protein
MVGLANSNFQRSMKSSRRTSEPSHRSCLSVCFSFQKTALIEACERGLYDEVKRLVDASTNVCERVEVGKVVHEYPTAHTYDLAVLTFLYPCILSAYSPQNGWTALQKACAYGRADVVKLLLDAGASRDVKASVSLSPFECLITPLRLLC